MGSRAGRGRPHLSQFFLLFLVPHLGPHWGRFQMAKPLLCSRPVPSTLPAGGRAPAGNVPDAPDGASRTESTRGDARRDKAGGPAALSHGPLGGRPALGALMAGTGHRGPSLHPLRGLSAPPPGLLAPSLFLLRRLSIQLELERAVKLESARELSRMFLPDMMSSPKPSWWEKA